MLERWALDVERWTLNSQNESPALIELIRRKIDNHGPVSFAWFMDQALQLDNKRRTFNADR